MKNSLDQLDIFAADPVQHAIQLADTVKKAKVKPQGKKIKEMSFTLAKFIGLAYKENHNCFDGITAPLPYRSWCNPAKLSFPEDELKFSESMDWLTPILDKIQSIGYSVVYACLISSEGEKTYTCSFVPGGLNKGAVYHDIKQVSKSMVECIFYAIHYFITNYEHVDGKYGDKEEPVLTTISTQ